MKSLSKLSPDATPVFLDTSVLINLLAANNLEAMPAALGRPFLVSEYVAREFTHDPRDSGDGRKIIRQLVKQGTVKLVPFDTAQRGHFMRLVGATPPDDLGDGEAATLACAAGYGSAAIDERKARRICARDIPGLTLYSSLDLLCSPQALRHFGSEHVHEMVRKAVAIGRMRVPVEWRDWVNAAICSANPSPSSQH